MADQPDLPDLDALVAELRSGAARLASLEDAVARGAPWPLSDRIGVEAEAHWGPPEVLAHLAEMVPFWTGEMERVLAGSPEPVPFGRVADDGLRIGVIERDRSLPPRELFARIASSVDRLAVRLSGLTPADAARRGIHSRLGEMSVALLAERFVVGHLDEHVEQLGSTVQTG